MKYYIYRIKYNDYIKLSQLELIKNILDRIDIEDKSKVIIVVSKSMLVVGAYTYHKERGVFLLDKKIDLVISKFYDKLPMVEFVNDHTYKMFSKRLREIDKENYEVFLAN